jgi:hypothetical protein
VGDGRPSPAPFGRRDRRVLRFKRVIGEGEYVVLHCHQRWPGDHDLRRQRQQRVLNPGSALQPIAYARYCQLRLQSIRLLPVSVLGWRLDRTVPGQWVQFAVGIPVADRQEVSQGLLQ